MFYKWATPSDSSGFAALPYINGISHTLTLKHYNRAVSKLVKISQQVFPFPKSQSSIKLQPNVFYEIPCAD